MCVCSHTCAHGGGRVADEGRLEALTLGTINRMNTSLAGSNTDF